MKSRNLHAIDDIKISTLSKPQVCAVFHARVFLHNVSHKFIEISMGRHVGANVHGHQHGGRK